MVSAEKANKQNTLMLLPMMVCGRENRHKLKIFCIYRKQSSVNLRNFVKMDFLYASHLVFIVILVIATHLLGQKRPQKVFLARKILHIGAISAVAQATFITPIDQLPLFMNIVLVAAIGLSFAVFYGFFEAEGRKSWGIAYFPWVLYVLLSLQPEHTETIALSFLILAVSDGFSALAGRYIRLPKSVAPWNATINGKTWVGFGVFVLSSWVLLVVYFGSQILQKSDGISLNTAFLTLFVISLTSAMLELISKKGSDNLFLPFWVFLMLIWVPRLSLLVSLFGDYLPVFGLLALGVWRKKWLSIDGVFTAILLAVVVLLAGVNMMPLCLFFLVGSLASKINKKADSDLKHGKPRDMWQVLANGGWVGFLALIKGFLIDRGLIGSYDLDFAVVLLMSAALGDTLSSEIGMRWGKNPFRITTGKPVPIGLSGGISFAGLAGALLGGVIMSIYASSVFEPSLGLWLGLISAALGGSLIDSLLGDWVQEKFERQGQLSDVGLSKERVSGIKGMNNDAINFMSLGFVLFVFVLYLYVFASFGN